mmetsp:Transcript_30326/g.79480  ORF Transcript_30326/g.79480 Transcript_30326/m.79480 type:complete len:234 (+) Transcript_30326:120-821(+)
MASVANLYYFHGRGRSQQARWVLAAAGVPFQNVCLSSSREMSQMRQDGKLTYGQLPMLEIDGMKLSQSMAIVRHAARLGQLEGKSPAESARIDELVEGISDARGPIIGFPFQRSPETAVQQLIGSVQKYYPIFEKLISDNCSEPFSVGASLSVADVLLAEFVESSREAVESMYGCDQAAKLVLAPYPRLRALHQHVLSLPTIKAFMTSENWFPFPAGTVGQKYVENVQTVLSR